MDRRSVLQSIGLGALAAPMAAQSIGGSALGNNGLAAGSLIGGDQPAGANVSSQQLLPHWQRAAMALSDPATLEAVREQIFEQQRIITLLDPDIANKRSFSLAAKIAFQRQRNVERELVRLRSESNWSGVWGVIDKTFLNRRKL